MNAQPASEQIFTFWLTGLSGAGKSTIAHALQKILVAEGNTCFVLDGDQLRTGLNQDLGFSLQDRSENIRRTAHVAKLMNESGVTVIAALISPRHVDRAKARSIIGGHFFKEIYVNTTLARCEADDAKGLYRRARAGEIANFTGIGAIYEVPQSPDLVLNPKDIGLERTLEQLLSFRKTTMAMHS